MVKLRDTRITRFEPLESPDAMHRTLPANERVTATVAAGRAAIANALWGRDRRLVVIAGPCSMHDPDAALDYARRLVELREELAEKLLLVLRVYFEKPRTSVGWKGMINDPDLNGSCDLNRGLHLARELLLEINSLGLPCGTEFLDPIMPQYTSDLVAWAAIGARTTESQTHREMASGLSMPVGFKNATDGSLDTAINAMTAARQPHAFLGVTPEGDLAVARTRGNTDLHLVMRGGREPNYQKPYVAFAKAATEHLEIPRPILIDCSHGNSARDYRRQPEALACVVDQVVAGEEAILGVMLESNLVAGKQAISENMTYGQSVTDACIDWDTTAEILRQASQRFGRCA